MSALFGGINLLMVIGFVLGMGASLLSLALRMSMLAHEKRTKPAEERARIYQRRLASLRRDFTFILAIAGIVAVFALLAAFVVFLAGDSFTGFLLLGLAFGLPLIFGAIGGIVWLAYRWAAR